MKHCKRWLSLLLALAVTVSLLPSAAWAAETAEPAAETEQTTEAAPTEQEAAEAEESDESACAEMGEELETNLPSQASYSGKCGDNANWKLDTQKRTLTISGKGAMDDYTANDSEDASTKLPPWQAALDEISESGDMTLYEALNTITVSEGITHIGAYSFADIWWVDQVTIPSTLVSIGESAFQAGAFPGKVVLPEGLTTIGENAFKDCDGITGLSLPSTLREIGRSAFIYTNLGALTIPKGVTEIPAFAFAFSHLTSLSLPDGLKSIGESAFMANQELSSVKIPGSVKSIGENAFASTALTSVTLSSGLETISDGAFSGCSALKSIYIPASVKKIGSQAVGYYYDEESGKNVTVPGFIVYGASGSEAERYAKENGLTFQVKSGDAGDDFSLVVPALKKAENAVDGVKVTWNKVDGAEKYQLWRKSGDSGWAKVQNGLVTGTSCVDKTAASGTSYTYTVRAIKGGTQSDYDRTGVSVLYLAAPTVTGAENQNGAIKVTWTSVTGAKKYQLWRKSGSEGWKKVTDGLVTGTSCVDTTAVSGTSYAYTVRAINGSTQSGYDQTGRTVVCMLTPELTGVENAGEGVKVTWNKVDGGEKYQLWRKVSGGKWEKVSGCLVTGTSCVDKTAESGTKYFYTVRAISGSSQSDYDRTGISILYLSAPAVTRTVNIHAGIFLEWKETPGANGYNIFRRTGTGSYTMLDCVREGTSYTDTSVQANGGTTYTYRVVAFRSTYKSAYCTGESIIRMDTPVIQSLTASEEGVTVVWKPVSGCNGYNIYRKGETGGYTKLGNAPGSDVCTFLDSSAAGLSGTYTYRVEAYRSRSSSAAHTKTITLS